MFAPLRTSRIAIVGLFIFVPWLLFFFLVEYKGISHVEIPIDIKKSGDNVSAYTEKYFGYTLSPDITKLPLGPFTCANGNPDVSENAAEYALYCETTEEGSLSGAFGALKTSVMHEMFLDKELRRIEEKKGETIRTHTCKNDLAYTSLNNLPGGITHCTITFDSDTTILASMYFFDFNPDDAITHVYVAHTGESVTNTDAVQESVYAMATLITGVEEAVLSGTNE